MSQLLDPEVPYHAQNDIYPLLINCFTYLHSSRAWQWYRPPLVLWDLEVYLSTKRHQTMLWSHKAWLYLSLSLQPEQYTTANGGVTLLLGFWRQINIKFPWDLGSRWVRWRNAQKRAHLATALDGVNMYQRNTCIHILKGKYHYSPHLTVAKLRTTKDYWASTWWDYCAAT